MRTRTNLGELVKGAVKDDRALTVLTRQICEEFSWVGFGRFNTHDAGHHGLQGFDDARVCKTNSILLS